MGSVPVFTNTNDPYGPSYGQSTAQIDKLVGSAYDVVREVAENLEYIKHVSAHLVQIYRIYQSVEGIDTLYENIEGLEQLLAHLDEIILIATNMDELLLTAANMEQITALNQNMVQLLDIYENLDEILNAGGTVIVSDTPPASIVNGRLWWESDTGNLYAYYNDGTSGQWVQVNIANPAYSWTEITDKPSTFPPSGHTHTDYVKDTGDTMTGPLVLAPPTGDHAALMLRSLGVTYNAIFGQTGTVDNKGSNRWVLFLGDTEAESGVSTGSDFVLRRHDNTGKILDSPIVIPRATGIPSFTNGLVSTTPPITAPPTTVATVGFVNTKLQALNEVLGPTFKVYGEQVIHIPPDTGIAKYSIAFGDGLKKSIHNTGNEGRYNVSIGFDSLFDLTTGYRNTFAGFQSGKQITTGSSNTGMGVNALYSLTTGVGNVAIGTSAMFGDPAAPGDPTTTGDWVYNIAIGHNALYEIVSGASYNIGIGVNAMSNPTVSKGLKGGYNNAFGGASIHNIEDGSYNQGFGYAALADLVSGNNNIAFGHNTGRGIVSGSGNVVIGHGIVGLTAGMTNTVILGAGDGSKVLVGSPAGVSILGANTNSEGLAGYVGEYKETNVAPAAAIVLTTNVVKTIAQLTLTPGDWDVSGWIGYTTVDITSVTRLSGSVSLAANGIDSVNPGASLVRIFPPTVPGAGSPFKDMAGYRRVSIAASTIVYLTAMGTFTLGSLSAWGKIWARRMR